MSYFVDCQFYTFYVYFITIMSKIVDENKQRTLTDFTISVLFNYSA